MASRSHVDVNERRLRPIYDCLDNGNNKKAIQEADKVLKKQKDLQCAKVLKALALLRLGRQDESSVLLQEIHSQHPTDEATLQAMAICYREVYKLEQIADLYENAHKSKPDNEEILSALFMAYVRLGDYKKQQQTAMSLHRLQPLKNPYYFWAVMSIVMQGQSSKDAKLAKNMFLPLAERMTKKYVEEGKVNAEAEVQLYLIILELMEKWEDALKLVKGSLGEKLTSELHFQDRKAAELYMKLEKWAEANAEYKKLLGKNPDHWQYWQEYVSSCLHLAESKWSPPGDNSPIDCDYTEEMAASFIEDSIKSCTDGRLLRGPYLARLELIKQIQDRSRPNVQSVGCPMKLLEQYYELFGDKFCCFEDMKVFMDLLCESERDEIVDNVSKTIDLPTIPDSIGFATNKKQMQRHITYLQMSRYLGAHGKLSTEEKLSMSRELIARYQHGLDFGKDLLVTDLQLSDHYLLLAAYTLVDLWADSGDAKYIWQAIVQLEKGARNSKANFHIKVLLMKLYCIEGAYKPCHKLFESLEVKHIMNDTLGHTVVNHVGRLGLYSNACATYGTMLRFFAVNHKETAEYLIASYKYGSFIKIIEFVKFREKLQNSLQYSCATVESMLLDLVLETVSHASTEQMIAYMEIDPETDKTNFEELCDNRDFSIMATYTLPRCKLEEAKLQSFKEEKAWLKIRNLSLRILAGSVMLAQQVRPSGQTTNGLGHDKQKPMHETLQKLGDNLKQHVDSCHSQFSEEYPYPIQGPYRTRLTKYLTDSHCRVFHVMLCNVQYIHSLQENGLETIDNEKEENLKTVVPGLISGLVSKHKCCLMCKEGERQSINPSVLENLIFIAETLSHSVLLAGVCHKLLKPLKSTWNKKSKKKKGDNPLPPPCTFTNFSHLISGLEQAAKDLHLALRDLDPVFLTLDLSNLNLSEPLCDNEEDHILEKEVWKKVEESYQTSVREVSEFIHNKMQYLGTLRL
ncbi:hypothetical protein FSP39_017808 [Pinctada imbricata]|uniref:N-terminal acetyltransferase B complex subunit NAA25 homolog n=1 Tax=Pinctada imbricata TaxID=66713 RepID=A0AA89BKR1_PINIB|nr:hypothetical protein FSP39_017808 [Pinctada imbricata]